MWLETREVFLGRKWPLYQPQNSKFNTRWTWAARTMLPPMATWMTWPGKMTTVLLTYLQGHKKEKIKTSEQIPTFRFELTWKAKNSNQIKWKCLEFQVCGLELPEATAWHGLYARVWIRGCEEAECLPCWRVSGLGEERPANEDHASGQGSIFGFVFHAQQTLTASILMDPAGTKRFDISLWS